MELCPWTGSGAWQSSVASMNSSKGRAGGHGVHDGKPYLAHVCQGNVLVVVLVGRRDRRGSGLCGRLSCAGGCAGRRSWYHKDTLQAPTRSRPLLHTQCTFELFDVRGNDTTTRPGPSNTADINTLLVCQGTRVWRRHDAPTRACRCSSSSRNGLGCGRRFSRRCGLCGRDSRSARTQQKLMKTVTYQRQPQWMRGLLHCPPARVCHVSA